MATPPPASGSKRYSVKTASGFWGPVPWSHLRNWLGLGWLPKETLLRDESGIEIVAIDELRLWTIAGRPFVAEDVSDTMASGKVPCSAGLVHYLNGQLGWPGELTGFNYYNADKLRKELEKLFPNPTRPLLNDPDWPECWGGQKNSPAQLEEAEREHYNSPASPRQEAVISFFGVLKPGVTLGEASAQIDKLLSDPEKRAEWDGHLDTEGATDRQLVRLRFAARKLHKSVPARLSKRAASQLIDEWYGNNSELEADYQQFKDDMIDAEIKEIQRKDKLEEDRDFRKSARPPHRAKASVHRSSGCLGLVIFCTLGGATGIFTVLRWIHWV